MKIKVAIAFTLIILSHCPSALAEHFDVPHVSVYGTATSDVVPDLMRWQLGVRSTGKTVNDVAGLHDKNVANVIAFLKREEIEERKIQTSQLQLAEDLEFRNGTRTKKGYYASTSIIFESKTLEAYRNLWMGLSKLATVTIGGVTFDTSKRIEVQNRTRINAIIAAKEKAATLAEALDTRIGLPILIEDEAGHQNDQRNMLSNVRMSRIAADSSGAGPSLSVGTIPIQMRVKAVFQLLH